jgi:hypothetical protein
MSTRVPAPALLSPNAPEIVPPTVRVLEETVRMGLAVNETFPVPRFKALLPEKPNEPDQTCGLLFVRVTALPLVLLMVPPRMVKLPAPAPKAVLLLMFKEPEKSLTPPEKILVPERVAVPSPASERDPVPKIVPLTTEFTPVPGLSKTEPPESERLPVSMSAPVRFKVPAPSTLRAPAPVMFPPRVAVIPETSATYPVPLASVMLWEALVPEVMNRVPELKVRGFATSPRLRLEAIETDPAFK